MYGSLKPGHRGRTRVEFYRNVRGSYKLSRWRYGVNTKYSSTLSKWTWRYTLPPGQYRIRARHWDSGHAKTYSSWRYFTVR